MATRTQLYTKIFRRLEDTAKSHWSEAEISDYIEEARLDLWHHAKQKNPSVLTITQDDWIWPANSRSIDLSAADGAGHGAGTVGGLGASDFDIYLVSSADSSEALGVDNLPVPLPRIPYEEINRGGLARSAWHEDHNHYSGATGDAYSYGGVGGGSAISNAWSPGSNSRTSAWALQGVHMYLTPVPRAEMRIQIEYVKPFAAIAVDGDPIFADADGLFRPWESLVELSAVLAAKGRSDEGTDPIMAQWQYRMEQFDRWLESREVTGTPRIMIDGY